MIQGKIIQFFPNNPARIEPKDADGHKGKVEIEEARQTRARRASVLTTEKGKTNTKSCVQCCATGAIRA